MTLTVDLGTHDHTYYFYDLSHLRLYTGYRRGLGVDSNICKVEDFRKPKIGHLTLMVDLENECQTHLCRIFRISGCKHDLCIDSNNFEAKDVENVETIYVSSTFDLESRGHTDYSDDVAYFRQYASY